MVFVLIRPATGWANRRREATNLGIVNEVMQSSSHPDRPIGLVAYRDRGDNT